MRLKPRVFLSTPSPRSGFDFRQIIINSLTSGNKSTTVPPFTVKVCEVCEFRGVILRGASEIIFLRPQLRYPTISWNLDLLQNECSSSFVPCLASPRSGRSAMVRGSPRTCAAARAVSVARLWLCAYLALTAHRLRTAHCVPWLRKRIAVRRCAPSVPARAATPLAVSGGL